MKTSKDKAESRPKKASETGNNVKSRKPTTSKAAPSEEDIRNKAYEIYSGRIGSGRNGSEWDDWREAEDILRKS